MTTGDSILKFAQTESGVRRSVEITYASLRESLASVLAQVATDQEVVIVRRRGAEDVALVPAAELAGLMKTAQLLRSRRNARRLLIALRRAQLRGGQLGDPHAPAA